VEFAGILFDSVLSFKGRGENRGSSGTIVTWDSSLKLQVTGDSPRAVLEKEGEQVDPDGGVGCPHQQLRHRPPEHLAIFGRDLVSSHP
jgi:hypothetical protein